MNLELLGALVGLARATENNEDLLTPQTDELFVRGLRNEPADVLLPLIEKERMRLIPNCYACAMPCGRTAPYDVARLRDDAPAVREGKRRLLEVMQALAGRENVPGELLRRGLYAIGMEGVGELYLMALLREMEKEENVPAGHC